MIYFDVTKTGDAGHKSGLMRVSQRLLEELGVGARPVRWEAGGFVRADGRDEALEFGASDWLLTAELFCEAERPGLWAWLERRPCRAAAIFHDAIPIKLPHITWPQSVSRHPEYMKMLARVDRVWAVSQTSRADLLGWWRWQGVPVMPPVEVLALGADFGHTPRAKSAAEGRAPGLLCVGIIEPRKNQDFLLDVCDSLWAEGLEFDLHVVGRVNPHFGEKVLARMRRLQETRIGLRYHAAASDQKVLQLYGTVRAAVFPTVAEGCGLPLIESLWMGVPCVASDLPVLRENAEGGGCLLAAVGDSRAWKEALTVMLTEELRVQILSQEAVRRPLPLWSEAARTLRASLG